MSIWLGLMYLTYLPEKHITMISYLMLYSIYLFNTNTYKWKPLVSPCTALTNTVLSTWKYVLSETHSFACNYSKTSNLDNMNSRGDCSIRVFCQLVCVLLECFVTCTCMFYYKYINQLAKFIWTNSYLTTFLIQLAHGYLDNGILLHYGTTVKVTWTQKLSLIPVVQSKYIKRNQEGSYRYYTYWTATLFWLYLYYCMYIPCFLYRPD